jgi:PBP1b-binding outer membrane lipoprotein LpoB
MKKYIVGSLLCALLFLQGCVTADPKTLDDISKFEADHSVAISNATAAVSKFAMAQAEKDPVQRAQLKADINQIVEKLTRSLDIATAAVDGTLTPDTLAADLKVTDANVQAFFDAGVAVYKQGYEQLEAAGKARDAIAWARVILQSAKVLSAGLNKATS